MKKSNVIVLLIAVIASAILLWLWFFLGFNHVDNPLDLVLSIVWWVLIVAAALVIAKVEKTRRERIRTCYVAPGVIYNPEIGTVKVSEGKDPTDVMQLILSNLDYGFDVKDVPPVREAPFEYVVRSINFKVEEGEKNEDGTEKPGEVTEWSGKVELVSRPDDEPVKFDGKQQLASILAGERGRFYPPTRGNHVRTTATLMA